MDSSGNSFIGGHFLSATITLDSFTLTNNNEYDFFVSKYSPSGEDLWAKSLGGTINEYCYGIGLDESKNMYIAGFFGSPNLGFDSDTLINTGNSDIFIAKLGSGITPVEDTPGDIPHKFYLYQNFPNPFNPTTTIRYDLPVSSFVSLKIYNILGQEIAILVNGRQEMGNKILTWQSGNIPSGVYFYRLQAGAFLDTKKLVITK